MKKNKKLPSQSNPQISKTSNIYINSNSKRIHNTMIVIAQNFKSFDFNNFLNSLTMFNFDLESYYLISLQFDDVRIEITPEQLQEWAFNDKVETLKHQS